MAEPWPVIPPIQEGNPWVVGLDGEYWTPFDTEAAARRYAALPVLMDLARMVLASEREGDVYLTQPVVDAARAALRAAGVEP